MCIERALLVAVCCGLGVTARGQCPLAGGLSLPVPAGVFDFAVTNGTATTTWTVPNTASLAGATFGHQVLGLSIGAGPTITAARVSDAVTLTGAV